jgi:hypothetical protein
VRGLPIEFSQAQITVAIHRLLGIKNVLTVTFSRAQDDPLGRHDGIAQIRCLNAVVYTHWCERKAVPLLGRQVDFSPHIKSLSGSSTPAAVARAQSDSRPTRQIIADAITAFKNETAASSTLSEFEHTVRTTEGRIIDHLQALGSNINSHTSTKIDVVQATHQSQHSHILHQLQLLSTVSKEYSNHMSGISAALIQGSLASSSAPPPGPILEEHLYD